MGREHCFLKHDTATKRPEQLRSKQFSELIFWVPAKCYARKLTLQHGLRNGRRLRGISCFLAGAFVFVESLVAAPHEFLGGFTGLVIGPPARKSAGNLGFLVLH